MLQTYYAMVILCWKLYETCQWSNKLSFAILFRNNSSTYNYW